MTFKRVLTEPEGRVPDTDRLVSCVCGKGVRARRGRGRVCVGGACGGGGATLSMSHLSLVNVPWLQ